MHCLELRPKAQEIVLKIAIRNICITFSMMGVLLQQIKVVMLRTVDTQDKPRLAVSVLHKIHCMYIELTRPSVV